PPILRDCNQLRSSVESATDRTTYWTLHRYSQQRDVTVVNFIAQDNEAHRLTFEILSQKLDLFGRVLDASDHVLHEPRTDAPEMLVSALSVELESDLRRIFSRSRKLDDVTQALVALHDTMYTSRVTFGTEDERSDTVSDVLI